MTHRMRYLLRYLYGLFVILAMVKWGILDSVNRLQHAVKRIQMLASEHAKANPYSTVFQAQDWEAIERQITALKLPCLKPTVRIELTPSGYQATVTCDGS